MNNTRKSYRLSFERNDAEERTDENKRAVEIVEESDDEEKERERETKRGKSVKRKYRRRTEGLRRERGHETTSKKQDHSRMNGLTQRS